MADYDADQIASLRLTEAHHDDNAFWTLGPITHEVEPAALFARLPDASCSGDTGIARCEVACYMVDALDAEGSILTDKEIPRDLAEQLMDEPIEVLRERFKTWLYETTGATG